MIHPLHLELETAPRIDCRQVQSFVSRKASRYIQGNLLSYSILFMANEAPRSKLRGITELNFEDFSEAEANPVASYGECSSSTIWSHPAEGRFYLVFGRPV